MLCEECGKNDAAVHFTQMINGEKTEKKICKECAAKKGFQSAVGTVDNIVSKMIAGHDPDHPEEVDTLACRNCGSSYGEFKNTGRLGCSSCYSVFEDRLKDLLRKIHGSTKHLGKVPAQKVDVVQVLQRIEDLRERLRRAVQAEQFEEAALLRDEIKRLDTDK